MSETRPKMRASETPQLTQGYYLGGWAIEITAPAGVTDFGLLELDLHIREHPNATTVVPIDIHLSAVV